MAGKFETNLATDVYGFLAGAGAWVAAGVGATGAAAGAAVVVVAAAGTAMVGSALPAAALACLRS
jgi:hypothetical protein